MQCEMLTLSISFAFTVDKKSIGYTGYLRKVFS